MLGPETALPPPAKLPVPATVALCAVMILRPELTPLTVLFDPNMPMWDPRVPPALTTFVDPAIWMELVGMAFPMNGPPTVIWLLAPPIVLLDT